MSDGWFRFYNTALEHPKVLPLSDAQVRAWLGLLSMASKLGGTIPDDFSLIARTLRKPMAKSRDLVQGLLSAGLLDRVNGGYAPHNWDTKQLKSDGDGAERVKRHRDRKRNVTGNVTGNVTAPHQCNGPETETETEQSRSGAGVEIVSELNRLNKLLGFDERDFARHAENLRILSDLKARGCDFQRHILPAAQTGAGRARSLAYIRPKALELFEAEAKVKSLPPPFENTDERGWRDRLTAFRSKAMWSPKWGPRPGDPGCKCPQQILSEAA